MMSHIEMEYAKTLKQVSQLERELAEATVKNSLTAQRPWVGLTGTEINHIFAANVGYPERMMKEVETLLKEKNS